MVDKVEARNNLNRYEKEIDKLQNLSRGLMTRDEMIAIDGMISKLKYWSANLRGQLYAESQKTRRN